ncbi:hypothetical protein LHYA1_G001214 [Lachnellula hyalina]|uniref:Transmembrane protein n=1 Tax=Lachnellula hyalina TaxID=1316788 RepID=A0A8H8R8Q5_9HELO|nr:uncharacterized protein LHYA1_G001214 [Lachnellula hyalina]TVY30679.1 hypothetical protein LHYA1_G001214 [Lachnellula hyalina]
MSPSRGLPTEPIAPPSSSVNTDTKANLRSSSALASAKRNIHFLFSPNSPSSPRPAHLRTRALLRSLRYIGIFVFWRVVRYARYALVGSLVAAVGASAFGGAVSGAAFLLAPPTLVTSVGIGLVWAAGKWGFRRMRRGDGEKEVEDRKEGGGVDVDGQWRDVQGPRAVPW